MTNTLSDIICSALAKAHKADLWPFDWTFISKDGTEVVNYKSNKAFAEFTYTKTRKFLGFTLGTDTFSVRSNSAYLDWESWQAMKVAVDNTAARFKDKQ